MTSLIDTTVTHLSNLAAQCRSDIQCYKNNELSEFLSSSFAKKIITAILNDDEMMKKVAEKSYKHSNGFDKFTLLSGKEPEFKLRLHTYWPEGSNSLPREFIHSHRWYFRSTLLKGSASIETFREADSGDRFFHHEYHPRSDKTETYDLRTKGVSYLKSDLMFNLAPNGTYSMGPDLLHRVVWSEANPTITIFVRWASLTETASVYTKDESYEASMLSVPSFEPEILSEKLTAVLRELA